MEEQVIRLKMGLDPKAVQIDKETRTLYGVIAIEPIDIKDYRPFTINDEFISDLVSLASKQKDGVKSNWGHNYNNLGKLLGRAKNWRVEDGKAKYDLTIMKTADDSPGLQGLGKYVMNLLEEDNNSLMTSIVFREDYFYQLDSAGAKLKVYYYDKASGEYIRPNPTLGKVYPKLKALYSSDIVEEGAATNSMFSVEDESESPVKSLFNKFKKFFTTHQEDDVDVNIHKQNQEMDPRIEKPATVATVPPTVEQLQAELDALRTENQALKAAQTPAPAAPAAAEDGSAALLARIDALEAKLNVTPAMPPVVMNAGSNTPAENLANEWDNDPINVEARKLYNEIYKK